MARDWGNDSNSLIPSQLFKLWLKKKKLGTLEMEVVLRIVEREGNPTPSEVEK